MPGLVEPDIEVYERDRAAEDGKLIAIDQSIFRDVIDGIGVVPACEIVYPDGP